jgi:4-amino-4-deoxy-L-arabinose transferase-like glycosyltransferase
MTRRFANPARSGGNHHLTEGRAGPTAAGPAGTILSGVSDPGAGRPTTAAARRFLDRPESITLALFLVFGAVFLALGLHQAWADSPTFDEPVYVAAGISSLTTHDLRINPEHPPLAKAVAALPALLAHPVIPHTSAWHNGDERVYSAQFLQAQLRAGSLQRVMFLARLVPLLEALAAGLVIYAIGRRLYGDVAGAAAALFWWAGPLVLGLGHVDGIDLPFTLAALLVTLALIRVLEVDRREPAVLRRLLVLGLACGLAASVKDTGLLLAALAPAVVFVSGWRTRRWRSVTDALVVGVTAWLLLWLVYVVIEPGSFLHPGLLPHADLVGLRYLGSHDTNPGPGYLLGSYWVGGRWWYWPATLLVKLPTSTLLFLLLAIVGGAVAGRDARRTTLAAVVLPALVITAFTVTGPRDIGVRYLLPVLALWLVAAGSIALVIPTRPSDWRRFLTVALAVLLVVSAVLTVGSNPHSIAWTMPPFRPGYRVASNSDVDWGQDFYRLLDWSRGKHPAVDYFGPRGITAADIPGATSLVATRTTQLTGWAAVSATKLTTDDHVRLSWLRAYCPLDTIGGSILLYRFEHPPDTTRGPDRPAPLCPSGATFSSRP